MWWLVDKTIIALFGLCIVVIVEFIESSHLVHACQFLTFAVFGLSGFSDSTVSFQRFGFYRLYFRACVRAVLVVNDLSFLVWAVGLFNF